MGTFKSTIRFDDDRDVKAEMTTVSLSGARIINNRWTVRAGLGIILDGELKPEGGLIHEVKPGGLATAGLEYHAFTGTGLKPSIDLSAFLSASQTKLLDPATDKKINYFATDLRLGAQAGWIVNGNIFPYAAARVFGGPVKWKLDGEDVTGSDIHHYQLSIGTAVRLGKTAVYVEWAGLGEQALSAGLSLTW